MKRLALALLLFLASFPALGGEVLIPAVLRGEGAHGTLWRTEIVVASLSSHLTQPVPVTITFHRDNGEAPQVKMPLAPNEVIALPDALFDWFSLESASGIILVTWDDAPQVRITARARIYTAGEHGEYGQSVPGKDTSKLVTDHFLPGLSGVNGNRTNVGISNPSASPTFFWISLYDTSGEMRGAFATYVNARSYRQFNDIFSYFQAGPLNAAMVRVTASDAVIYAYASIVRNDSGDAIFVTSP